MAATCTFDQWRKDAFFSAAEAVQESADVMESTYRMWLRDGSEGLNPGELCRELQTALGTAKWQLEEFERAVKSSRDNWSSKDHAVARHKQFVAAIGTRISLVEDALRESLIKEGGKQPFRWVQLDDQERDDLAVFLSTADCGTAPTKNTSRRPQQTGGNPEPARVFCETLTTGCGSKYVVELEAKRPGDANHRVPDRIGCAETRNQACNSADVGSWKIVIADEEYTDSRKQEVKTTTSPNSINAHLNRRFSSYFDFKPISWFSQTRSNARIINSEVPNFPRICSPMNGMSRSIHGSQSYLYFVWSLKIAFLLVVSLFLIVPVVFSSR